MGDRKEKVEGFLHELKILLFTIKKEFVFGVLCLSFRGSIF